MTLRIFGDPSRPKSAELWIVGPSAPNVAAVCVMISALFHRDVFGRHAPSVFCSAVLQGEATDEDREHQRAASSLCAALTLLDGEALLETLCADVVLVEPAGALQ